jgi:hypothetical protein
LLNTVAVAPVTARCGPVVVVPTARRVLASAALAPLNESSSGDRGVVRSAEECGSLG